MRMLYVSYFLLFLFSLGIVSAVGNYSIEFNQLADKLVVKENNSGNYSSWVVSNALEKTNEGYIFLDKTNFNNNYDSVRVKLHLDKGFVINNNEAYPTNYLLETDGQTISLVWNLEKVNKGSVFAVFVNIEDTNKSYIVNLILWFSGIVLFLVVCWFVYYKFFKNGLFREVEKHLLDSEKKVMDELENADKKELWQKQLQLKTGFSKAKLSRIIRDLEARSLIKKIPVGNTNKIILA